MEHLNLSSVHLIRAKGSFWRQWFKMSKKEILIQFRYPVAFFADFVQIIIIILFFTFSVQAFLPANGQGELNIAFSGTSIFFGFVIYYFVKTSLHNVGNSLRNEQITGTLESVLLSPSSTLANMLSRMTYTIILNIVFLPITYLITFLAIGEIRIEIFNVSLWVYMFFTLTSVLGLSFALAGLALKLKEAMQPLLGFFEFFLMIFSGVFFPMSLLGSGIFISLFIPFAYGVDLVKTTVNGNAITDIALVLSKSFSIEPLFFVNFQIILVLISGIILPLIGVWFFHYTVNQAKKTGTLTQF